jgi:ribosome maturation factor RimP
MVHKSAAERNLLEKLEPVISELGYECRDIEVLTGGSPCIRVTIDHPIGPDGRRKVVDIEDCSKVHRVLGPMFDVWDPLPGAYSLEMSSPGEHPPLRVVQHFQEAVGGKIRFQTTEPIEVPPPAKPRKKWEGTLETVSEAEASLTVKDVQGVFTIPFEKVRNASWLREWTVQSSKDQEK